MLSLEVEGNTMEGFDPISAGVLSILPPLLALALALLTKEVYSSLAAGVFSGLLVYEIGLKGFTVGALIAAFTDIPRIMAAQISGNGALILFLALLGSLTVVIAIAGGSRAYAEWVTRHVKNAKIAQLMTAILGVLIFVDDYFNCLTVGTVMRPVTDKFGVSREKLAWIIDSTAAPICIIAPVSSWAVAVSGYLGDNGFSTFISSIPYNFYALFTLVFIIFIILSQRDFGAMRDAELAAQNARDNREERRLANLPTVVAESDDLPKGELNEFKGLSISDRGRVTDLVIPIVVLIAGSILGMMYAGGYFNGVSFSQAIGEDPVTGLCIGVCFAIVVAGFMFIPRKLMNLDGFVRGLSEGSRSVIGAIIILVLAWSLGGTCRHLLSTGKFVSGQLDGIGVSLVFFPAVLFVVAAFMAFAMGTSWGTFALLLPIALGMFPADSPLYLVAIGAVLGGSVYGDHISPISDTTILSSTGADCDHISHVFTQIPYATLVMVISVISSLIASFTETPWIALGAGLVLLFVSVPLLSRVQFGNPKGRLVKNMVAAYERINN